MRIDNDTKLDYKDVLIRPKRSTLASRKEVNLQRQFQFRNYQPATSETVSYSGVPVMASNMDGVGTFTMADALAEVGLFSCLVKHYDADQLVTFFSKEGLARREHVAYSMGITERDFAKFNNVYKQLGSKLKYVCVDVANGYSERFSDYIKQLREAYPHIVIIAGNVVTGEMTEELLLSGADIIKVGIGPGSVCTTRIQTGVGYPQLSALIECADAAHGLGGHIIADGGCTCPGDVAKAFAGGADFVMLGGMLAGHDEGGGEVIDCYYQTDEVEKINNTWQPIVEQRKFVQFYGMSSEAANTKHFGGLKEYRSSEGREVLVPYRGRVAITVQDLLGGVRSTCTYAGANSLKQLSKCTTFVRVSMQFNGVFAN
ncbi:MAG: GMP reductase [Gammaproteobacteria bacterium]|nr:GMP reductase [Gammaproteobacteria bacterium]MCP4881042.1 GMP reductase [Gammaproteobacteria bacterium]MDP6165267.1 GMP reductase [Gammaproteobacteria bacterium]